MGSNNDDICKECGYNSLFCNVNHFKHNFKKWSSGNSNIDKLIQGTQLSAHYDVSIALEWIPYKRLTDIKYISEGGFGKIYRAKWKDGNIQYWDTKNKNWERCGQNMIVALKSLNNSKKVTSEFTNEVILHYKIKKCNGFVIEFYGITQDPKTKNYMMVMEYAENGSLRNYLDKSYHELKWENKIHYLCSTAFGLASIHENEVVHRNLHSGNVLKNNVQTCITDVGLCKPADYNESENTKNGIYGVLPYIAPEILRGQIYTKAADVYSFGIIMYEIISGLPPYYDVRHDENLAIKICQGLRPRFNMKIPPLIVDLIKKCLDANPLNRPDAFEVRKTIYPWWHDFEDQIELKKQIKEAEASMKTSSALSYEKHSGAIYTSRLLCFNNLPEPKNSDNYYEQNDNIISIECSEFFQIDISQLKISDKDQISESEG
ncbi:unnamed protein product [Rhizophagus irregularis]|nr:unnamed protein product [Rhizophagus irregularis]